MGALRFIPAAVAGNADCGLAATARRGDSGLKLSSGAEMVEVRRASTRRFPALVELINETGLGLLSRRGLRGFTPGSSGGNTRERRRGLFNGLLEGDPGRR